jgi:hypothetical protein
MDIRLYFHEFWGDFNKNDNIWLWLLRQNHNVILDDINPNLVITMGTGHKPFPNAYTIYYCNEPYFPNLDDLDTIANHFLSNFYIDIPNHTRFPSYYMYIHEFIRTGLISDLSFFKQNNRKIPIKTHFCCFVSKSLNGKRGDFFHKLSKYKQVDTNVLPYGHFNVPYDNSSFNSSKPKIEFIKKYKFNIAFENNYRGGYQCWPNAILNNGYLVDMGGLISEKLIEPFISGTIPIYWGSKMVSNEFNPNTFLNYYDFDSEDKLIEKIIELDNDDNKYNDYFKEPISTTNQANVLDFDYIISLLDNIIKNIK